MLSLTHTFAELGRPQIHGYPLASVAFTSSAKRLQFVSGADEKIVRVFDAPKLWVQTLQALSGVDAGDAVRRAKWVDESEWGLWLTSSDFAVLATDGC